MAKIRVRAVLGVALLAAAAANAGETLIVAHKHADSVGYYDTATGKQLLTIPVGVRPHEMVLSRDGKLLYVTNYGVNTYTQTEPGGNTISIIDVAAAKAAGEIPLGNYHRPHGIERGRSGRLYVTIDFPPSVLVIDPARKKIARAYEVGAGLPHMLAVREDERKVWTADAGSGSVTAIALDSGAVKHIAVGGVPMGIALSPDGKRVYACTRNGNTVAVIDAASDEVKGKIELSGQPARLHFTPDRRYLLVSLIESGEVAVIDPAAGREVRRIRAGASVEGLGIDPAARFGYVSAQGDNKIVKFSLKDWSTVLEIKTDARPDPIVIVNR